MSVVPSLSAEIGPRTVLTMPGGVAFAHADPPRVNSSIRPRTAAKEPLTNPLLFMFLLLVNFLTAFSLLYHPPHVRSANLGGRFSKLAVAASIWLGVPIKVRCRDSSSLRPSSALLCQARSSSCFAAATAWGLRLTISAARL